MAKLYRPISSFVFAASGKANVLYSRDADGEPSLFAEDDPAVKAHPELFTEFNLETIVKTPPTVVSAPVEQATKGPGEKRATKRA